MTLPADGSDGRRRGRRVPRGGPEGPTRPLRPRQVFHPTVVPPLNRCIPKRPLLTIPFRVESDGHAGGRFRRCPRGLLRAVHEERSTVDPVHRRSRWTTPTPRTASKSNRERLAGRTTRNPDSALSVHLPKEAARHRRASGDQESVLPRHPAPFDPGQCQNGLDLETPRCRVAPVPPPNRSRKYAPKSLPSRTRPGSEFPRIASP